MVRASTTSLTESHLHGPVAPALALVPSLPKNSLRPVLLRTRGNLEIRGVKQGEGH